MELHYQNIPVLSQYATLNASSQHTQLGHRAAVWSRSAISQEAFSPSGSSLLPLFALSGFLFENLKSPHQSQKGPNYLSEMLTVTKVALRGLNLIYGVVINRHHVEIMSFGMKVNMKNCPSPFRGLALVKRKGSMYAWVHFSKV